MIHPLEGCWLKVERAKEHRDSLDQYITDTFAVEANRPRFGLKFEKDTGEHVIFVSHMPDLSHFVNRCSVILGDILNNLRSALDRLVYQLALFHTGGAIEKPNRIQFPITDTPGDWDEEKKRLREIAPAHVAIIKRLQEHNRIHGRFYPLGTLRNLANTDKHRIRHRQSCLPHNRCCLACGSERYWEQTTASSPETRRKNHVGQIARRRG